MRFFMIILNVILTLHLSATIINIPGDQSTIQEGINVSVNGDTILVQPGIYFENLNYDGKAITVASHYLTSQDSSYIISTIIDGGNQGNIVTIENVEFSYAIFSGFTIQNGFSTHGGGIFCHNSLFSLNNVILENCEALDQGGAIYCNSSSFNIENCTINNNNIAMGNGIINCLNSEIFSNNLYFHDNYSWDGGGLLIWDSNIQINNSIFENNHNEMMGGSISLDNVIGTISNCIVQNNVTIAMDAGGIFINQSEIDIVDTYISNNEASMGAGLSVAYNSEVNLINSSVSGNNSGNIYPSEGILSSDSNIDIYNCIIENNSCGIDFSTGTLVINNSDLLNNNYRALNCSSSQVTIDSCSFSQNEFNNAGANCGGGAIMVSGSDYDSFTILNSIFTGNSMSGNGNNIGGGAIYTSSNIYIKNCIFTENNANISGSTNGGSAIYFNNSNSFFSNCIFWDNSTFENGGVISLSHDSNAISINSIIYNNSPNNIEYLETSPISYNNTISIYYSDIQNGEDIIQANGFGSYYYDDSNIDFDPLFEDAINENFILLSNSPCIDTGSPSGWLIPPENDLTIDDYLNYNCIGDNYDIGTFEYCNNATEDYLLLPQIVNICNYPNPFNPSTTINFSIRNVSKVELALYNIKGQKIKTLAQNEFTKGSHSIIWNGDDKFGKSASSGIYYYKLSVNGKTEAVKKCLLLK